MAIVYGKTKVFKHGSNTIGDIVSMTFGPKTRAEISATTTDSTAHEYRPGLLDAGSISLTIMYDPADTNVTALEATMGTDTVEDFSLDLTSDAGTPVTKVFAVEGFVTSWELNGIEVDSLVQADIEIKCTGAITIT